MVEEALRKMMIAKDETIIKMLEQDGISSIDLNLLTYKTFMSNKGESLKALQFMEEMKNKKLLKNKEWEKTNLKNSKRRK